MKKFIVLTLVLLSLNACAHSQKLAYIQGTCLIAGQPVEFEHQDIEVELIEGGIKLRSTQDGSAIISMPATCIIQGK